ncbi:hypothetical protein Bca52824_052973 [Brassica carinata]|uniref:Uncharacterized protein n=1 Tax=Brassica carinata TaxID=52824 RepID=A0A8X7R319_BRACI|nr:hypothetical protein Bca52824_052973 [Brassica carinata]
MDQICEAPSTSLPRSFTINTSTATRERCRFVSDYSHDGGGRENTAVMRRPLDLRRNYSCKVVGRIDEKKACDAFEEEVPLQLFPSILYSVSKGFSRGKETITQECGPEACALKWKSFDFKKSRETPTKHCKKRWKKQTIKDESPSQRRRRAVRVNVLLKSRKGSFKNNEYAERLQWIVCKPNAH